MDIQILASGSSGNCYHISDGTTELLLDVGIPFKRIQKGLHFNTGKITGCLVTHRHTDHSRAIMDILRRGIPVYSNQDVKETYLGVCAIPENRITCIGTFDVYPFFAEHDVPCYGYIVTSKVTGERLLYLTDTAYTKYIFPTLNYILIEANYDGDILIDSILHGGIPGFVGKRIIKSHMSIDTVIGLLHSNDMRNVKEIYLLHLSNGNSDAVEFKLRVQKETGAVVHVY